METIYYNGNIITMEGDKIVSALLIKEGKIAALGSDEQVLALRQENTQLVDLEGKTLLPSFIDAHSHITALAQTLALCPLGGCTSFEEILQRLEAFRAKRNLAPGQWLLGFGYDHNILKEGRHPDKILLDSFAENPVAVVHASGHMGVTNSLGLQTIGIDANTPNPEGGVIGRMPGGQEPNGYLEETAFTQSSAKILQPSPDSIAQLIKEAEQIYLSYGVTTIQDGITKEAEAAALVKTARDYGFTADVVSYVDLKDHRHLPEKYPDYAEGYQGGLRFGGYKIFLDGSPQGRTAWMSQPYEGAEDGYCGYPIYQDEQVTEFARTAIRDGKQLLTHCNGDDAAAQLLRCYRSAMESEGSGSQLRPVMIHAQTVRLDQLDEFNPLGMMPSYFVAHVNAWGDVHRKNFGSRAELISPVKSTIAHGIPYTFHQDTPVLPPDMLHTVWAAVNRITASGVLLGAQERVTPMEALRGVTCNGAYQYFEEDSKGTLAIGKRADLVILDGDPLTVDPMKIREIHVLETIKDGQTVYTRKA